MSEGEYLAGHERSRSIDIALVRNTGGGTEEQANTLANWLGQKDRITDIIHIQTCHQQSPRPSHGPIDLYWRIRIPASISNSQCSEQSLLRPSSYHRLGLWYSRTERLRNCWGVGILYSLLIMYLVAVRRGWGLDCCMIKHGMMC